MQCFRTVKCIYTFLFFCILSNKATQTAADHFPFLQIKIFKCKLGHNIHKVCTPSSPSLSLSLSFSRLNSVAHFHSSHPFLPSYPTKGVRRGQEDGGIKETSIWQMEPPPSDKHCLGATSVRYRRGSWGEVDLAPFFGSGPKTKETRTDIIISD